MKRKLKNKWAKQPTGFFTKGRGKNAQHIPLMSSTGKRRTSSNLSSMQHQKLGMAMNYKGVMCEKCKNTISMPLVGYGPKGGPHYQCPRCGSVVGKYGRIRKGKTIPVKTDTTPANDSATTPTDVKPKIVKKTTEKSPPKETVPKKVTEKDYYAVPIPSTGEIGKTYAPLIEWSKFENNGSLVKYKPLEKNSVKYMDYSSEDAPNGVLPFLRESFRANRKRVCKGRDPVNVIIQGPAGTGKSLVVKKFAEETQLPYYYVPCDAGVMSKEQLLGRKELETDENGKEQSVWHDGPIVKAVRNGGILHIDEASLLDPEVATTFHSVLDANRELKMENVSGGTVKAHPDLFVILTLNPAELNYGGTKPLSPPLKSRGTRKILLDYPPQEIEMQIIKTKAELTDSELKITSSGATGKFARDIGAFMNYLKGLRDQAEEFTYIPTLREAVAFAEDLKDGIPAKRSIQHTLIGGYVGEERVKAKEAMKWHE